MNGYINRWTVALGWMILMAVVGALFVPAGLSVTSFVLLGLIGLTVAFFGSALIRDSQPPRSVGAILDDLENAQGTTGNPPR